MTHAYLDPHQRVQTDQGPMALSALKPGALVLTHAMRFRPVVSVTPRMEGLTDAVLISVISNEGNGGGRALALLAGVDSQVLVENTWVPAADLLTKTPMPTPLAALSANAKHPQLADVKTVHHCKLRPGTTAAVREQGHPPVNVQVEEDNSLFVNGVAVRCPQ